MPSSIFRRACFAFTEGYVDVFLLLLIILSENRKKNYRLCAFQLFIGKI